MKVLQAYEEFMRAKRVQGLTEKSLTNYKEFVMPYIVFVGLESDISVMSKELTFQYIELLQERAISKASLSTYIRHIKCFLRWVECEYEVDLMCYKIKVPRMPKKVVYIYSDDDIKMIFDNVIADDSWIVARNKAIIVLMLDSGLRQNECCTLLRSNVSYTTNTIKILGKGNKERIVPFGRFAKSLLLDYETSCPYDLNTFFVSRRGEQMTCDSVKHMINKMARRLPFQLSSHKLRHNFGTQYCIDQLENFGKVDIYSLMYLMGHEEIKTTKRYLHFAHQIIALKSHISHLDKIGVCSQDDKIKNALEY